MVLTVEVSLTVQTSKANKKKKADEAKLEVVDDLEDMEIVENRLAKTVEVVVHLAQSWRSC